MRLSAFFVPLRSAVRDDENVGPNSQPEPRKSKEQHANFLQPKDSLSFLDEQHSGRGGGEAGMDDASSKTPSAWI